MPSSESVERADELELYAFHNPEEWIWEWMLSDPPVAITACSGLSDFANSQKKHWHMTHWVSYNMRTFHYNKFFSKTIDTIKIDYVHFCCVDYHPTFILLCALSLVHSFAYSLPVLLSFCACLHTHARMAKCMWLSLVIKRLFFYEEGMGGGNCPPCKSNLCKTLRSLTLLNNPKTNTVQAPLLEDFLASTYNAVVYAHRSLFSQSFPSSI